jgi:hypothetical protein
MHETLMIVGYQRGSCALCEKDDRDTLHLRCSQGMVDGYICLKCAVQPVNLRKPAAGQVAHG